MRDAIGTNEGWQLSLEAQAVIDFHYPASIDAARYEEIGYVRMADSIPQLSGHYAGDQSEEPRGSHVPPEAACAR